MSRTLVVWFTALILLALAGTGRAQAPQPAGPAAAGESDAMTAALERVRLLGERIAGMKSDEARVRGLADLGRAVCAHDKALAERFFLQAHEIALAADNPTPLFSALLPRAARCDIELALRLEHTKGEDARGDQRPTGAADVETAQSLLHDNPEAAARFAERSLQGAFSDVELEQFLLLMVRLRRENAEAADALFLQSLAMLRAEPRPTGYRLLVLGNYTFTSPFGLANYERFSDTLTYMSIEGVNVYNVSVARPGMPPALPRAYLETAADILLRPQADPQQQRADYAAAWQLIAHARALAPELVPLFELVMQRLGELVPPQMKQDSTYAGLATNPMPAAPDSPEAVENEPDPDRRNIMLFGLAEAAMNRGEFDRARELAARIEDRNAREQILRIVAFREAERALAEGELDRAQRLAAKLSGRAKQVLLLAGIGAAQAERGQKDAAFQTLQWAQREVQFVQPRLQPYLLAAIAMALADVDRDAALAALRQAVPAFNVVDAEPPAPPRILRPRRRADVLAETRAEKDPDEQMAAGPGGFRESVILGPSVRYIPLRVKGLQTFDFGAALLRRFGAEPERAEAILLELADEKRRAAGMAALSAAILEAAAQARAKTAAESP